MENRLRSLNKEGPARAVKPVHRIVPDAGEKTGGPGEVFLLCPGATEKTASRIGCRGEIEDHRPISFIYQAARGLKGCQVFDRNLRFVAPDCRFLERLVGGIRQRSVG